MTDFGKILEEWDGMRTRHDFASMLDSYPPESGDHPESSADNTGSSRSSDELHRGHPRNWPVDRRIDLHGMTVQQASVSLENALNEAVRTNQRKLLIIHGKGLHSRGEPVLKKRVMEILDAHPRAGMRGQAPRSEGGSGALWVAIK